MKRILALVVAATAFGVASESHADPTIAQFRTWNADGQTIYLRGLHDGLLWANGMLEHRGETPLFCAPERLALTTGQISDIVERYSADNPDLVHADDEYGVVALEAMMDVFPCSGSANQSAFQAAVDAAVAAAEAGAADTPESAE